MIVKKFNENISKNIEYCDNCGRGFLMPEDTDTDKAEQMELHKEFIKDHKACKKAKHNSWLNQ